jgi:uncharacterized repeat protein (TIGR03803 family)
VKRKLLFIFILVMIAQISFAQFTKLLNFLGPNGKNPWGSLVSDGTYLYGMTSQGGTYNWGTIFKIKPDGSGFVKIRDFGWSPDGSSPYGSLLYDGTFLYGMTFGAGSIGYGTIFKIKPDGTGYVRLLDFAGTSNGAQPMGSLIFDGTYLYGMTNEGGVNNMGTIFKIKRDGTGYLKLLDFAGASNGKSPRGSFISDATYLYGMTKNGGANDSGTVFRIKPDGTAYLKLLDLSSNVTGTLPWGSLISDGTFLYGINSQGGSNNIGTVFKIKTDGTGFVKLMDFSSVASGTYPQGSLIFDGTYLLGYGGGGGTHNAGTIFKIKTDGSGFQKLHDFDVINGTAPFGEPLPIGNYLYGLTYWGGFPDSGTVFKYEYICNIPSSQATSITFTNVTSNSVTLNWTNGNGTRRIVKIKPTNTFTAPVNGNDYPANTVYSGSGEQAVYNGTGNSVTVTGLASNHFYWFRVYEASCSSSNSLYMTSVATGNPKKVFTQPYQNPNRPGSESEEALSSSLLLYPNPTTDNITISLPNPSEGGTLAASIKRLNLYSPEGKLLKSIINPKSEIINLDLQGLSAGVYFLDCRTENGSEMRKVVKY